VGAQAEQIDQQQSKGAILLSGLACGGLWPQPKQPSGTVVAPSLPKAA